MLFRGRPSEESSARRFDTPADEFTVAQESGLTIIRIVGSSEHVLAHMYALSAELPGSVDVAIDELRTGRSWRGEGRPLTDVRDALNGAKKVLGEFGGVEWSIFNREDQITVTPHVELYIVSRTDRWLYLVENRGVQERQVLRGRSWRIARDGFPDAPQLVTAIAAAVTRLGLEAG
jgi:hypothetical protein